MTNPVTDAADRLADLDSHLERVAGWPDDRIKSHLIDHHRQACKQPRTLHALITSHADEHRHDLAAARAALTAAEEAATPDPAGPLCASFYVADATECEHETCTLIYIGMYARAERGDCSDGPHASGDECAELPTFTENAA